MTALAETAGDPEITAVVLIGAGKHLMSGSDLREFDRGVGGSQLPEVLSTIERHPRPVIAAVSGSTQGGGFELALACDRRVALESGRVGLQEATLDTTPGAGGIDRSAAPNRRIRCCGPASRHRRSGGAFAPKMTLPAAAALRYERAEFLRLRQSPAAGPADTFFARADAVRAWRALPPITRVGVRGTVHSGVVDTLRLGGVEVSTADLSNVDLVLEAADSTDVPLVFASTDTGEAVAVRFSWKRGDVAEVACQPSHPGVEHVVAVIRRVGGVPVVVHGPAGSGRSADPRRVP